MLYYNQKLQQGGIYIETVMFRDYDFKGIYIGEVEMTIPIALHWHTFYEIDFFTSGERITSVNGTERTLSGGDLALLSPSDYHSYPGEEGILNGYTLRFSENDIDSALRSSLWKMSGNTIRFSGEDKQHVADEMDLLYSQYKVVTPYREEYLRNILNRLIILISRKHTENEPSIHCIYDPITAALNYIDQHFRAQITLEETARSAGYSKSRFSIIFHEKFGITFRDYVLRRRLQWAHELIKRGDMSVTQICFDAGFSDVSYFGKMFKKEYGIRPVDLMNKSK